MAIEDKLNRIIDIATLLQSYRTLDEKLLLRLSNIEFDDLNMLQRIYNKANLETPINYLRKEVINQLLIPRKITSEWLNEQKSEIERITKKSSFKSYSNFSIFYPFIEQVDFKIDLDQFWLELTNIIVKSLGLDFKNVKRHWVNFNGARGFGSDRTWMAIYNSSHPNQTTAKQFFFQIDSTGIAVSLYDRFNDKHVDRKKISDNENFIEESVSFFRKSLLVLLGDNFIVLENRKLGVKGCNVYKLSHGTDFFDHETIQYCITNNLAIIHEETGSKGRQSFSQFELFESAKIGDVFYLTHGNSGVLLIGQFVDESILDFDYRQKPDGWKQRKYKLLFYSPEIKSYKGTRSWWSPNDPSTFVQINQRDFNEVNESLFIPHFKVELDPNIDVQMPSTKSGIASDMEIPFIDKNVDPKLDVNLIASQFARLINNMKSEKGQFLGIFGRWGRGKTYFAERVFDLINNASHLNKIKYKTIEFNAWKYQDSNAIWAYIYESLQNEYFDLAKDKWLRKLILTWKLNLARKGKKEPLILLLLFLASFSFSFFIPPEWKMQFIKFLFVNLGVIMIVKTVLLYRKYSPQFKQVYKDYSKRNNFNNELGLHAEIQNEIKILLKTWFNLKTHTTKNGWVLRYFWKRDYKRIIFFIDDLDRCDESRIIQVIDSLRVMLEDEEIVQKIIIVGAIDETILKTAIEWKYRDLLEFQDKSNGQNHHRTLEITTREYLDKLFIGGIKLPALNTKEQHTIIENYALRAGILETIAINVNTEITINNEEEKPEEKNLEVFEFPQSINDDIVLAQNQYFLLQSELSILQSSLDKYKKVEFTPRQLRIYLNRYLFAKNLASSFSLKETGIRDLDESFSTFLADQIAAKTVDVKVSINIEELKKLELQPEMEGFTLKVIEMVVPY